MPEYAQNSISSISNFIEKINNTTGLDGFKKFNVEFNKYVKAVNQVDITKLNSLYNLAWTCNELSKRLGSLDKFTKTLANEIAKVLTEGKICVLSENSNSILIIPTFFIDYFYNDEDNYQKKFFVYFVKVIRLLALFITIFAPSIYLSLITYDEAMLPTDFLINFSLQRSGVPFPALIEAFILMITFELLYEADALTPTTRGTSLSILGALVLGDAAVNAGIVSPIMVIVVAITAISSIIFTYQDFQSFIRFYRYLIMLLSSMFGMIGIFFGFLFLLTNICSINSFGKPFLYPLIIMNNKSLKIQNTEKRLK